MRPPRSEARGVDRRRGLALRQLAALDVDVDAVLDHRLHAVVRGVPDLTHPLGLHADPAGVVEAGTLEPAARPAAQHGNPVRAAHVVDVAGVELEALEAARPMESVAVVPPADRVARRDLGPAAIDRVP